jgi:hypothetical protein
MRKHMPKQPTEVSTVTSTRISETISVICMMLGALALASGLAINFFVKSIQTPRQLITVLQVPDPNLEYGKVKINGAVFDFPTGENIAYTQESGNPTIPYQEVRFLVPQGEIIENVAITYTSIEEKANINLPPAQPPIPSLTAAESKATNLQLESSKGELSYPNYLMRDGKLLPEVLHATPPNRAVYTSDQQYPGKLFLRNSPQFQKGYELVSFSVFPFQYKAKGKILQIYHGLKLSITTKPAALKKVNSLLQPSSVDRQQVQQNVLNPEAATTYTKYPVRTVSSGLPFITEAKAASFVKPSLSSQLDYEYIIITPAALQGTWNGTSGGPCTLFSCLLKQKLTRQQSPLTQATIVTTEDIQANYPHDTHDSQILDAGALSPSKIRNFIIDAYQNWKPANKELFILLGGDTSKVPFRGMAAGINNYFDNTIPADIYYAGLDGTWDTNGDGLYGYLSNEQDFLTEVFVGRAPVDTTQEVQNFTAKTSAYENHTAEDYPTKALFVGEDLYDNYNGGAVKDTLTQENLVSQYSVEKWYVENKIFDYINPLGHLRQNYNLAIDRLNQNNIGILNVSAHGNEGVFIAYEPDVITTNPFLAVADSCLVAAFDCTTYCSETGDAIAEDYVKGQYGAFAFIGNSRYGWGGMDPYSGTSKFDRSFFAALQNANNQSNLSYVLQRGKESVPSNEATRQWTMYSWNLLGDPETPVKRDFLSPQGNLKRILDFGGLADFNNSITGVVDIYGTAVKGRAQNATFDHYALSYGKGLYPTSWETQAVQYNGVNPQQEVPNGLLGQWNVDDLVPGAYTLKLEVFDTQGRKSTHYMIINTVRPTSATIVLDSNALDFGDTTLGSSVTKTLTVSNGGTKELVISNLAFTNAEFSTTTTSLTLQPNESGEIVVTFKPTASSLTHEGVVTITSSDVYFPMIDVSLFGSTGYYLSGWPKYILGLEGAATADLNQDGKGEILALSREFGGGSGELTAYTPGGAVYTNFQTKALAQVSPENLVVGDVNNDGYPEIATFDMNLETYQPMVQLLDRFGQNLSASWPKTFDGRTGQLAIADVNTDGIKDIVALTETSSRNTKVIAWDNTGTQLLDQEVVGYPASMSIGDANNDGSNEVVFTVLNSGQISVYGISGLSGVHTYGTITGDTSGIAPILADVNGDGSTEIIVATQTGIHVMTNTGVPLPHWPITASPAAMIVADLNVDGLLELIYIDRDQGVIVQSFSDNNNDEIPDVFTGWPKSVGYGNQLAAANLDQDSALEVIASSSEGLKVWHVDGTLEKQFPIQLSNYPNLIIEDLLNTGAKQNIIDTSGSSTLYIFNVDTANTSTSTQWGRYRFSRERTNTPEPICLDGTVQGKCNLAKRLCDRGSLQVVGDANSDGSVDIADVVFLVAYIFSGGSAPKSLGAADADSSGDISISDAVYLVAYIFSGGPAPVCPTEGTQVKLAPDAARGYTLNSFKTKYPQAFTQIKLPSQ